ncbi:MATE family efflux transporter [Oceanotoga sp. DSM 15011]|uniref:MATE family efflux transporter n=1 Tax=Oceanotoga sp. DSM 15011 TaxID=2984951 RepID=UPI0021F48277|nr:MATE family efflux transporter [Oceanotoga sp. DSM 15011]UYP00150.1 MATE family efflux transporter [Oceanotoga sp. DSM 15011]
MNKYKKVLKIALPAVGEMVLFMLVWVIDTAFIGRWGGNDAVSAVGISTEILYTIAGIMVTIGISVPITSLVAQKFGAKKMDEAEIYLANGLRIGFLVSLLVSILLFIFKSQVVSIMGAKGQVFLYSMEYMKFATIGVFFNMMSSLLNSGLRGIGRTDISLISAGISNILNIFLDWVLIYGKFGMPEMGVAGSALATLIAFFVSFLFLSFYYFKFSDLKIKFKLIFDKNKEFTKKIIQLAIPSGFQEGAFSLGRLLNVAIVLTGLGSLSAATNQIVTTVESISFMPGWGFSVAATSLVGQMIGAKDKDSAIKFARISALLGSIIMTSFAFLYFIFPEFFIGLFIDDPLTIELGKKSLRIAAFEQTTMAISMVYAGALKGYGDTKTPFFISLFTNWAIRLPLIFVSVFLLKLPLEYVWGIMVIQWFIDAVLHFIMFKKKMQGVSFRKFRKKRVL